jgi:hypothetical protein
MEQYTLRIIQQNGTGVIYVNTEQVSTNGDPVAVLFESGTAMTVTVDKDAGFSSFTIATKGRLTDFVFGDPTSTFTMPTTDVLLLINYAGTFTPPPPTGDRVKYVFTKENIKKLGNEIDTEFELTIEEEGYTGFPIIDRGLSSLTLTWGRRNGDVIRDWLVPFQLEIGLVANRDNLTYDEFLSGDNRKYRALLRIKGSSDVYFEGYISPDVLSAPLQIGDFELKILAVEGFSALQGTRVIPERWASASNRVGYNVFGGILNQTFGDFRRPLNIACQVYETRMDDTEDCFAQFEIPDAVWFEDGQDAVFTDGTRVENERLRLSDSLYRLLQPWIGRVFLYNNEFYFHRLADLEASTVKYFPYDDEGTPGEAYTLQNSYVVDCIDSDTGSIDLARSYTEVTVSLNLGKLTAQARGSEYKCDFGIDHWTQSAFDGLWRLRRWRYENCFAFSPTGTNIIFLTDLAPIYFLGDGDGFCRIYTTTSTAGLADTNISYIELMGTQFGENVTIVDEGANTISLSLKYRITKTFNTALSNPTNLNVGIMVKIGSNNWLNFNNDNTFTWGNTENVMLFPFRGSVGLDNTIDIQKVTVPVTGEVTIRLYQLIIYSGTTNLHQIDLDDFQFVVEENSALIEKEIQIKAVADQNYSHVYDKINLYMGDVPTALSTSAIRLNDPLNSNPYTQNWSRDGVEELELIQICAEEIMNRVGKRVRKIYGYTTHEPDPRRAQVYEGVKWLVNWFQYDVYEDKWQIEIHEL